MLLEKRLTTLHSTVFPAVIEGELVSSYTVICSVEFEYLFSFLLVFFTLCYLAGRFPEFV